MTKMKRLAGAAVALCACSILVGCSSSPPADESKPVQAGDGSQKPMAAGATGGGAAAPTGNATGAGATKAN